MGIGDWGLGIGDWGLGIGYKSLLQVKAGSTQTCQLSGIEFRGVVEPFNLAKDGEI